jgi:cytochrome b pre-mRNA-processing protein 3
MNAWMHALRERLGLGEGRRVDAGALHAAVVARARDPEFYEALGVADTIEGRFEMLCMHAFLVLHRLKREGEAGAPLGQAMVDTLFLDLDRALREMGVGDLSVGKRMKSLGQAFYGRLEAYEGALAPASGEGLAAAVERNVFAEGQPVPDAAIRLAAYMRASVGVLGMLDLEALRNGALRFAAVPAAGGDAVLAG